jgi:hypothetical protein
MTESREVRSYQRAVYLLQSGLWHPAAWGREYALAVRGSTTATTGQHRASEALKCFP